MRCADGLKFLLRSMSMGSSTKLSKTLFKDYMNKKDKFLVYEKNDDYVFKSLKPKLNMTKDIGQKIKNL